MEAVVSLHSSIRTGERDPLRRTFGIVRVPVPANSVRCVLGNMRRRGVGDSAICQVIRRVGHRLVDGCAGRCHQVFSVLLSGGGCPIIVRYSSNGKHANVMSTLILTSLKISRSVVVRSCHLDGSCFGVPTTSQCTCRLPTHSRRTVAALFSTHRSFLGTTVRRVRQECKSASACLRENVNLAGRREGELRSVLLASG